MTSTHTLLTSAPNPEELSYLPAELLDGVTDAVMSADPAVRSNAIYRLVREMYESVAWLDEDLQPGELVGLLRVVEEARQHQARMATHSTGSSPLSSTS